MLSAKVYRAAAVLAALLTLPVSADAIQVDESRAATDVGILVMAHGGDEEWNEAVLEATAPVASMMPTAVAFGMADPVTLQAALDSLRDLGVEHVAVVRMFLSGASFLDQTEYLLGLSETPPAFFVQSHGAETVHDAASSGSVPRPLQHRLDVATHRDGLVDAREVRDIVVERALDLSTDPENESVLLLAHGMGEEALNDALLGAMGEFEHALEGWPFRAVRVAALREDWAEPRAAAEERIRAFVRSENDQGRRVIVIPARLSGFGPYADVLEGLDYVAGAGLLPHEKATDWVMRVACAILCAEGWDSPLMTMMLPTRDAPVTR